jgi:DNA topoisomerase-1
MSDNGGRQLVIVESPAKAKTIAGYLGDGYVVESSIGHVRDLPQRASDVPASHKAEKWAKLGIDVEHDFEPLYVVSSDKKAQIARLRSLTGARSAAQAGAGSARMMPSTSTVLDAYAPL